MFVFLVGARGEPGNEARCGLNRVVGVHVYDWMCMKPLVRRGTSWRKGVVIVRSSNCCRWTKV